MMRAAAPLLFATLSACYAGSADRASAGASSIDRTAGWVGVRNVQAIRQRSASDCGAAAVATIVSYWGQPTTLDEVAAAMPPANGAGLRAGDLKAFVRSRGLRAFVVKGRFEDLDRELAAGRPALVGLVQRYSGDRGIAHYVVVTGVNLRGRRILFLDPARGYREDSLEGFAEEWAAAAQLAMFVSPPPAG